MADSIVRSRIDPVVKDEANQILKSMGLTLSDGIRLLKNEFHRLFPQTIEQK